MSSYTLNSKTCKWLF